MNPQRTIFAFVAIALAAVLYATLGCDLVAVPAGSGPQDVGDARTVHAAAGDATATQRVAATTGAYAAPVGREMTFSIESATDVQMQMSAFEGDKKVETTAGQDLQGELTVTVLDRRADELLVAIRFPRLQGSILTGTVRNGLGVMAQEMARPTILRMKDDGRLLGYRFPECSAVTRRNVRSLLSGLFFVIPGGVAGEWETDETDAVGASRTRYVDEGRSGAKRTIVRERLRYAAKVGEPTFDVHGTTRGVHDATVGWMRETAATESLTIEIPEGATTVTSTHRFRFELARVVDGVDCVPAGWHCSAAVSAQGDSDDADVAVPERNVHEVLLELTRLAAREQRIKSVQATRIYTAIADLVIADPAVLAELRAYLRNDTVDAEAAQLVMAGIGYANTEAADAFFASAIADSTLRADLRQAAVTTTLALRRPSAAVLDNLEANWQRQGDRLGATSLLMLGAGLGRVAGPDAIQRLLDLEGVATQRGQLETWLGALGNAGKLEVLPAVSRFLAAPDVAIRRAAVDSLRKLDHPRVGELLRRTLATEGDAHAAERAARWLSMQSDLTSIDAAARLLQAGPTHLRFAVLAGFKRRLDNPKVMQLVRDAAAANGDANLRAAAGRLL